MVPLRSLAAPAAPSTGGTWDLRRQDWASAESSNQTWQWRILHYLSFPATLHLLRWFPPCSRKFSYAFPMKASMSSGDFLATLEDTFIAPALRSFLVFQDRFVRLNDHFMVISWWYKNGNTLEYPSMKTWRLGNPPTGWGIPSPRPVEGMCWWVRQTLGRYLGMWKSRTAMVHICQWRVDPKEMEIWFN